MVKTKLCSPLRPTRPVLTAMYDVRLVNSRDVHASLLTQFHLNLNLAPDTHSGCQNRCGQLLVSKLSVAIFR